MSSQQVNLVEGGSAPKVSFMQNLQKVVRLSIRDYGMYIALFVIMAFFTWQTNGLFISFNRILICDNNTLKKRLSRAKIAPIISGHHQIGIPILPE